MERLKGYTIGIDVFDRAQDFDPQLDSIVRVEAGRLRRLLDQYYVEVGRSDPIRIAVPKGGYVATFSVNASGNAADPTGTSETTAPSSAPIATGPAIIVLPFGAISSRIEDQLLADGLTEQIIANLSRFTSLLVLAQDTSLQFKNKAVDVRDLARTLEVRYALVGSVRHASGKVRFTTRLLDATNATLVWSETYDRVYSPDSLLELQDEIAARVVASTAEPHGLIARRELAREPGQTGRLPKSYLATLHYHAYMRTPNPSLHETVRNELVAVTRDDPDYSMGWFALSALTTDEALFQFNPLPAGPPALDRAASYARRALELDARNHKAYESLLMVDYLRGNYHEAFAHGERALALNPHDAETVACLGCFYCFGGQWEKGLSLIQRAQELSPFHTTAIYFPLMLHCYRSGDDERALRYSFRVDMPGFYFTHVFKAMIFGQLGQEDQAAEEVSALLRLRPDIEAQIEREFQLLLLEAPLRKRCLEGLRKAGLEV